MKPLVLALTSGCLVLALAACGGSGGAQSAGPAPSFSVEAVSAETPTFELWFIGDTHGSCCGVQSVSRPAEELGIPYVGKDFAVGPHLIATLVEALLAGPSRKEAALGYGQLGFGDVRPGDIRLLGVSIENGIVTLDLSAEFRETRGGGYRLPGLWALAQVVYTVTQFPEIEGVRFKVEGRPLQVPAGSDPSFYNRGPECDVREAEELLDRPVTREDYENAVDPTGGGAMKSAEPRADGRELLITAEFDAPKHLVYKAWTTPELVERWWRDTCGKVTAEIDLKVGGTWRYVMVTSQGDEVAAHGEYRELVPNERIVSTEVYDVLPDYYDQAAQHQQMLNTFTFTEVDGRTRVTILIQADREIRIPDAGIGFALERVVDSLR